MTHIGSFKSHHFIYFDKYENIISNIINLKIGISYFANTQYSKASMYFVFSAFLDLEFSYFYCSEATYGWCLPQGEVLGTVLGPKDISVCAMHVLPVLMEQCYPLVCDNDLRRKGWIGSGRLFWSENQHVLNP